MGMSDKIFRSSDCPKIARIEVTSSQQEEELDRLRAENRRLREVVKMAQTIKCGHCDQDKIDEPGEWLGVVEEKARAALKGEE